MKILPLLFAAPLLGAAPQQVSGLWSYQFQNGIGEYLTGEWDSATGGALNLSCLGGGRVAIMAQIKGQAPPPRTSLVLTASSRTGSRSIGLPTDAKGTAQLRTNDSRFVALWRELRARDIVTLRYADGRTSVQSLAGAQKLLPARPCG